MTEEERLRAIVRELWEYVSEPMMFCAYGCRNRHECLRRKAKRECDHRCEWREDMGRRVESVETEG